jgi:hypothetical protein
MGVLRCGRGEKGVYLSVVSVIVSYQIQRILLLYMNIIVERR